MIVYLEALIFRFEGLSNILLILRPGRKEPPVIEPIRVLHVVTNMNRGGLETMLMNYYRRIDRNKIQFDFLTHSKEENAYDKEIVALGGIKYWLLPLNPFSPAYRRALNDFFRNHKEYGIVHAHLNCMSALAAEICEETMSLSE